MGKHDGATRRPTTAINQLGQVTATVSATPKNVCSTPEVSPGTHLMV